MHYLSDRGIKVTVMSEKENLEQLHSCDTNAPFVFISYSAKDGERVSADALELQRRGYNVWLDSRNLDRTKASWKMDALDRRKDPGKQP